MCGGGEGSGEGGGGEKGGRFVVLGNVVRFFGLYCCVVFGEVS